MILGTMIPSLDLPYRISHTPLLEPLLELIPTSIMIPSLRQLYPTSSMEVLVLPLVRIVALPRGLPYHTSRIGGLGVSSDAHYFTTGSTLPYQPSAGVGFFPDADYGSVPGPAFPPPPYPGDRGAYFDFGDGPWLPAEGRTAEFQERPPSYHRPAQPDRNSGPYWGDDMFNGRTSRIQELTPDDPEWDSSDVVSQGTTLVGELSPARGVTQALIPSQPRNLQPERVSNLDEALRSPDHGSSSANPASQVNAQQRGAASHGRLLASARGDSVRGDESRRHQVPNFSRPLNRGGREEAAGYALG